MAIFYVFVREQEILNKKFDKTAAKGLGPHQLARTLSEAGIQDVIWIESAQYTEEERKKYEDSKKDEGYIKFVAYGN